MEFNEKLQELRKKKGITQEELAQSLYVSRTAVSKWESGRGYPNIDSLKAIAKFFSVTVDDLLSSDEILTIAVEEKKEAKTRFRDLVFGLVDLCAALLLFLPFFAVRIGETVQEASLLTLDGVQPYLKALYFAVVILMIIVGALTLALQGCEIGLWRKAKTLLSLSLGGVAALLFIVSLQPYAAVFALALLAIKIFVVIKR